MKNLVVMAAGLGYEGLEKRGLLKMAGLEFRSAASAFPAGLIIQYCKIEFHRGQTERSET